MGEHKPGGDGLRQHPYAFKTPYASLCLQNPPCSLVPALLSLLILSTILNHLDTHPLPTHLPIHPPTHRPTTCALSQVDRHGGHTLGLAQDGILMFSVVIITVHAHLATAIDQWTWMHHAACWGSVGEP